MSRRLSNEESAGQGREGICGVQRKGGCAPPASPAAHRFRFWGGLKVSTEASQIPGPVLLQQVLTEG